MKKRHGSYYFYKWVFKNVHFSFWILLLCNLLTCYASSLIKLNIRSNFNSRNPGYGKLDWFIGKWDLNCQKDSQWYIKLLFILLTIFLVGNIVLSFICSALKGYCTDLNKFLLYDLVISQYLKNSTKPISKNDKSDIKSVVFDYIGALAFYSIDIPVECLKNVFGIIFEYYFLNIFLNAKKLNSQLKNFSFYFNSIAIWALFMFVIITFDLQKRIKKENLQHKQDYDRQINEFINNLSLSDDHQLILQKLLQLNKQRTTKNIYFSLWESFFSLPFLLIPGLSILFYLLYYTFAASNFSDTLNVYLLSLSVGSILWKFCKLSNKLIDLNEVSEIVCKIWPNN